MDKNVKIIVAGGAGLVGQNLIISLKEKGYKNLVVLDKHRSNLKILKKLHPDIVSEEVDLAVAGEWLRHFKGCEVVVMLQAQIGGENYEPFVKNNIDSTKIIIDAIKENHIPYLVHVSSSVVKSMANDFYTETKKEQEALVLNSNLPCVILRPTLMFGWFDRKHLGWLSRLMQKIPIFPIPGNGHYMRQPLYVKDFCSIIISCIENKKIGGIYNISGHEHIDYIDIIHTIKRTLNSKTLVAKIPYRFFYLLLKIWAIFDKNPPFTSQQLKALVTKDEFEVIDWPQIFGVSRTSFEFAICETLTHPLYKSIILVF